MGDDGPIEPLGDGGPDLPFRVVVGEPGVQQVGLSTTGGGAIVL
jgi:hypothetical protein